MSAPRPVLTTNAPCLSGDAFAIQKVVRVRVQRGVERDDVAARSSSSSGRYSPQPWDGVVGQYPTAEALEPIDDRGADATGPDDPDGQVTKLLSPYLAQAVVVGIRPANHGLRLTHRHQHQHQRVVRHAVGRIGDGLDGDPDALGERTSMWLHPTLRVEMCSTPARLSARSVEFVTSLL